jgi:hypothetical protein
MAKKYTRLWRIIKILVINTFILVFGIVLIELIFGGWFTDKRIHLLNVPRNVSVLYNLEGLYDDGDSAAIYIRDQYGFRGSYPSPDEIDILTVGGSTTDQRYITEGKTWQDVLAKDFKSKGKTVYVVNAGIDGQTTLGHLKNLEWWFPYVSGLQPKYILYYIGINELFLPELSEYDNLYHENFQPTTWDLIRDQSAIFYLYRTLRGTYEAYKTHIGHKPFSMGNAPLTEKPLLNNHEVFMDALLMAYKNRLHYLLNETKEMGATPICVTQVYWLYKKVDGRIMGVEMHRNYRDVQINGMDFYYMMQLINQVTLSICREEGGIPIDLAGEIEFADEDFYDSGHNTPLGTAKIGSFLFKKLHSLF